MNEPTVTPGIVAGFVRWIAKVWGIASVGLVLFILIGEAFHPTAPLPTSQEWLGLFFFPLGVCLGIIVAWRWEGLGGGITLGSLLAFYAWLRVVRGRLPGGPYFTLIAAPGILFLVSWLLSR
jgi:hypothetical protein